MGHENDQERRRQEMLKRQKLARQNLTSTVRTFLEVESVESETIENIPFISDDTIHENNISESFTQDSSMEITNSESPSKSNKNKSKYSDQLMLAEYLNEIPSDFEGQWYCMAIPNGIRCIVYSGKSSTISRRINGKIMNRFYSLLPNGSPNSQIGKYSSDYCILDCIFYPALKTYFILDVISWRGYELQECTTEFRFFWKMTKLEEMEKEHGLNVKEVSPENPFAFLPLPYYDCSQAGIQMATGQNFPFRQMAIYFYHKETAYTAGETPLLCSLTLKTFNSKKK